MEVVLLWLDDLDDLVFVVAAAGERIRRAFLEVGLVASIGLAAAELYSITAEWAPLALACVAGASVLGWSLCGMLVLARRMERALIARA